ncbi:aminotransferase class I/II-fold pyridoxal phosphate-dependent enzyme [Peribacillus sp. SCS-155]|uniref:aminotransferase class I/II-fold pyridoxal phosphate-dependent enzyme n=1 Tax=Peribacillus sedimenti TaxID=3115297 RepID=UPI003905B4A9
MDQTSTPLFNALLKHKQAGTVSFHVPGHKNGTIFPQKGEGLFQNLLSIDATELSGLDDLHEPEGPILEAQALLSDLYSSKESLFLVNGTTVGNLAMIMAVSNPGDTVLVQRNCHKSILHGQMLAGLSPVFVHPEIDPEWQIAGGLSAQNVEKALAEYPQTKAVILTHPNYYGMSRDLAEIVQAAHKREIPVLVDEAHGAHFAAGHPFPLSALEAGADVVVHSAHKTLPAMTMGSYLHLNRSSLVSSERIKFYLQMLQSSSPSYPIMASLDLARAYLAAYSKSDKASLERRVKCFKEGLARINGLHVMEPTVPSDIDLLKITIRADGISGFALQQKLEQNSIYTELADTKNVLFVLPLLKKEQSYPFDKALSSIERILQDSITSPETEVSPWITDVKTVSRLGLTYSEMRQRPKKMVHLNDSIGKISAETITPYPPGVPLIMAGERISSDMVLYLRELVDKGSRFHGGKAIHRFLVEVYK